MAYTKLQLLNSELIFKDYLVLSNTVNNIIKLIVGIDPEK